MSTIRWRGDALPVAQVTTIAVTGTWATADTASLTINGKTITVTVGSDVATTDIVDILLAMVNGNDVVNDETRNETGNNIPEFSEITATDSGSTLTLTGVTKGVPFTVTASESTAGSGALGTPTETTAASGPNHVSLAANWVGGVLPADGDTVVIDDGGDLLYGLDQNAITPAEVRFVGNNCPKVGLPVYNESGGYAEYRDRYLAYGNSGDATNMTVDIDASNVGRINFAGGSGQMTISVYDTGNATESNTPAVQLTGTHASNVLNVTKGDVGCAFEAGETMTIATLRVGFDTNVRGDATVILADGVTLTAVNMSGGLLTAEHGAGTVTIDMTAGELTVLGSAAVSSLDVRGGEAIYNSTGTLATGTISGRGVLDFSRDLNAKTVTNPIEVYGPNAVLRDPNQVVGSLVIDVNEEANGDNLDIGRNIRLTRGTPA